MLPELPSPLEWVMPRTAHPWAYLAHVNHPALDLTLCGRVRPGEPATEAAPICDRCLSRLRLLA